MAGVVQHISFAVFPRFQVMSMAATTAFEVANLVLGEADGQIDERPGEVLGLHNFRWSVVLPAANEASKSFSTG
ncbi:hypothetical protein P3T21_002934 [Paraburkholderia sp. GAS334]